MTRPARSGWRRRRRGWPSRRGAVSTPERLITAGVAAEVAGDDPGVGEHLGRRSR